MTPRLLVVFICRRLVAAVAITVAVSFAIFVLLYAAPGSVEQTLLAEGHVSQETLREIRAEYHLDYPFLVQYWLWLKGAAQLDLGTSVLAAEPVLDTIVDHAGITVALLTYAFALTVVVGIPLGVLAARHKGTIIDRGVVGISVLGLSTPAFVSGVFMIVVFGVWLGWFPVFGEGDGFLDRVYHLTLPAVALAVSVTAILVRFTRAALLNVFDQDYVVFARARGVNHITLVRRYVLRNALIPIVAAGGLLMGIALAVMVLVEVAFALPGLGSLLASAIDSKDVPIVQGVSLLFTLIFVGINLLSDLLYVFIDPRLIAGAGREE